MSTLKCTVFRFLDIHYKFRGAIMSKMYEVIERLCSEQQIKPGKLCSDIGISRGIMSDLKAGRTKRLSAENIAKVAAYFGVTTDYIIEQSGYKIVDLFAGCGGPARIDITISPKKKTSAELTSRDFNDIARDVERIMAQLDSSGDLMFDGDPMTAEARESMLAAMQLGLQAAKLKNKERFTPKKHKKG